MQKEGIMKRFCSIFFKLKIKNNNKGFTLIELITAITILALLSGALYTLFFSGSKTFEVAHDSYLAQNNARIAMSYLTVKIRQNDAVTSSGGIISRDVDVMQTSTGSALTIKSPSGSDRLQIYSLGGQLLETTGAAFSADGTMITDGIESVTFTTSSGVTVNSMNIGISVKYKDGKSDGNERSLDETVTLRAEP